MVIVLGEFNEHVTQLAVPALIAAFNVTPLVFKLNEPPAVAVVVAPSLKRIEAEAALVTVSPVTVVVST
jgi:hypothetical protein